MTKIKKQIISAMLVVLAVVPMLTGCAKPNAEELATKIVTDYAVDVADLGYRFNEFSAVTSLSYQFEGSVQHENYTFTYQKKGDDVIINTIDNRESGISVFTQKEVFEYYYNGWYMNQSVVDGITSTTLTPTQPQNVTGSGNAFTNYMSLKGRLCMPAETFNQETLVNLSAKKSGNRIIVTANGAEDSLSDIHAQYFTPPTQHTLQQRSYVGSKGMVNLTSISFEYIIKSDRIIKKTVVMTGKVNTVNDNSQIIAVDATLTHVVDYSYSATASIRNELKDLVA